MERVKRSNTVNITVTAGSLILESPVLPVMKGDNVTLRCTKKHSDDDNNELTTSFYKDGVLLGGSSTGNLTLHSVSRSDEGLYKCSSSGAGDSAESWLIVTAHEDPQPASLLSQLYLLVSIGISVSLLSLLLFLGVLQCQKHETATRGASTSPSSQSCSFPQTVSAAASMAEVSQTTYAAITKPRKEKVSAGDSVAEQCQATYTVITRPMKVKGC
ncbi:uncharacterized protein LOC130164918 [Seriola aureovittata]|uniref:uncharacterized protein LOC130164918 n=1 Tax=Seriola aureovittata TaxID=2871759 RepID=UPI0024BDA325|nr:uncharacterized protein LOC130164918 [Seriola aureovittata]